MERKKRKKSQPIDRGAEKAEKKPVDLRREYYLALQTLAEKLAVVIKKYEKAPERYKEVIEEENAKGNTQWLTEPFGNYYAQLASDVQELSRMQTALAANATRLLKMRSGAEEKRSF